MLRTNLTFIDLFAGCGGLSLGLMSAGFKGLFAIEKDPQAFSTLKHNLVDGVGLYRFDWPGWLHMEPISIEKLLKNHRTQLEKLRNRVDLVVGGPPCQGFSMAGKRNATDPRNNMVKRYMDFVYIVKPKFLLVENVIGITTGHLHVSNSRKGINTLKKPYSEIITERLEDIGYKIISRTFRSVDYGVPQSRPRHVFIGIRSDVIERIPEFNKFIQLVDNGEELLEKFKILDKTMSRFLRSKGLEGKLPVTVKQAISDFAINGGEKKLVEYPANARHKKIAYKGPRSHYQRLLHVDRHGKDMNGKEPNSLRLTNHKPEIKKRFKRIITICERTNRKGVSLSFNERDDFGLKKHSLVVLNEKKPSHTITTLPDDILHYCDARILTVRENARLQSFPDWFEFLGNYTTGGERRTKECPRYTQVGNAVPPFLGEYLGMLIKEISRKT